MSRRYPARLLRLGHKATVAGQRLEPAKDEARAKAKTRSPGKDRTRQRRGPRMYEMQGPRLAEPGIPADCPGELAAGAIGEPHPVRPTTGPGHLPEVRLPGLPADLELLLWVLRVSPEVIRVLLLTRSCLRVTERSEAPRASSKFPGVSPRSPEVVSEWYPFSLVEKLYSHSGMQHKRIWRLFSRFFSRPQDVH